MYNVAVFFYTCICSVVLLKGIQSNKVGLLCFDLLIRPKMPFKMTHRKEVIHSNGSYEKKSRERKLADEMGRGKKKHYTLID